LIISRIKIEGQSHMSGSAFSVACHYIARGIVDSFCFFIRMVFYFIQADL